MRCRAFRSFTCLALLLALAGPLGGVYAGKPPGPLAPVPPLAHVGRWLVDATGRVVMLHGVNDVNKQPPYHSVGRGFGEDDIAFLVREGFNALRLGIDMRGLMPVPGQVEPGYIDQLAITVAQCARAGIFVLLDFHQDGYAPKYNGNGFPDWMAIDDGLPNPPDAFFPLYYIQNPAMQRAFEHFWANDPIPGGLPLQTYYMQAVAAVGARFGHEPMVLGTELMNEPWPGAEWRDCALDPAGCPAIEAERLLPFHRRGLDTLRSLAPQQLVWVEPFVLFNFGQARTTMPGTDPGLGFSFHSYALDATGEQGVARFGAEAAVRDGAPVLLTEFGATEDPALLNRLLASFDANLLPWMFWSYDGHIVRDERPPLGPATLNPHAPLASLVRPYPVVTTGVPTRLFFDPATRLFNYDYTTERADGGTFAARLETVVYVPPRQYPDGYTVTARGARVLSAPCATQLRLRTKRPGTRVEVLITPGTSGPRSKRCRPVAPPF